MTTTQASGHMKVARPSKTLRELTLEKMRDSILNFYFRPGERLIERDLCAQLGVSRTIVREVLRHLESEGLVSILPNRGPIVAETSPDEAWQIYEIRGALEAMAARACADMATPRIIDDLDAALEDIASAYADDDLSRVLVATTSFYQIMFQAAGREMAWSIVSSLTVRINHLRSLTIKTKDRSHQGPQEMKAIVDAIRRRDGEAASSAAKAHVETAALIARTLLLERLQVKETS